MANLSPTPIEKTIFTLSYLSNINANYLAATEQDLVDNIVGTTVGNNPRPGVAGALKSILNGDWKVVCGPFTSNSQISIGNTDFWVTDNALYMAEYTGSSSDYDGPKYVIAVAGTNPFSMKGWLDEDFLVSKTVDWPPSYLNVTSSDSKAPNPKISQGTSNGLEILLSIPSTTNSISTYIQNNMKNVDAEIAVAGHSLGGALSPALSLALAETFAGQSDYSNLKFSALPTAGPTPGNSDFAQLLNDKLHTYDAIYNAKDVVPQAWNNMAEVPNIYDGCSVPIWFAINGDNPIIQAFFKCASSQPAMDYERLPNSQDSNFTVKTWDNGCISSIKPVDLGKIASALNALIQSDSVIMDNLTKMCGGTRPSMVEIQVFCDFIVELGLQHTTAYTSSQENGFQLDDATFEVIQNCMNTNDANKYLGGSYVLEQFTGVTVNQCYSS